METDSHVGSAGGFDVVDDAGDGHPAVVERDALGRRLCRFGCGRPAGGAGDVCMPCAFNKAARPVGWDDDE